MSKRATVLSVSLLIIGALAFKLFEPVFVYTWGWKQTPGGPYPSVAVHDPGWAEIGLRADAWLMGARHALDAPALSAAVSVNGERVWAGAVGYANLDSRTDVTLETVFPIGSSSKAVTSIAMGVLLEELAVDLDVPVSKYIEDIDDPLSVLTTRQAMSHTAGVRNYGVCLCFPIWEYYNRKHFSTQRDALRPFENSPLLFTPGSDFSYSSYGYNVAGAVIEAAGGLGFGEFLKQRLFSTLGANATRATTGTASENDAVPYEIEGGDYKKAFRVDNTNKLPSGGILSTPSDMATLGYQMIVPTLFSQQTRDLLIRRQTIANGRPNPQGYALGWRNQQAELLEGAIATPWLHHHGVAYGAVSHFSVYPKYGVVVSVMINRNLQSASPLGEQADRLTELFLSEITARESASP